MAALLAGKTPQERKQIIIAAVLGVVSLFALYMAFGRSLFGGSTTTATVKISPSPTPRNTQTATTSPAAINPSEQIFGYETTPVDYRPGLAYAPDAGRNIFAFYEPPPPCPECPTPPPKPSPTPPIPTPTPIPTPPIQIQAVNPPTVYAGSKGFKLEILANQIPADAKVYMNQKELATTIVSGQKIVADVAAMQIGSPGTAQILIQTPNGVLYSNPAVMQVLAPPKPQVQYIGMISRARHNNDTAYFMSGPAGASPSSSNSTPPFSARLNDVVQSRFRLIDISPREVVFEDVNLGFKHHVPISTLTASPGGGPSGFPGQPQIQIGPDGIPIINGVPQPPRQQQRDIDDGGRP